KKFPLYIKLLGLSRRRQSVVNNHPARLQVGIANGEHHGNQRGDAVSRRWMMMTNGNASDTSFSPPIFHQKVEK
ncbi:hypothetical protein ACXZEX_004831, partial [Escherichia coli]